MPVNALDRLREILAAETIAVVGCSRTPGKAAHEVPNSLAEHGYDVIPDNPYAEEIFGRRAVATSSRSDTRANYASIFAGVLSHRQRLIDQKSTGT